MTIWDKLRAILKSEAADVGDELGKARDKFDEALTRKEEEMAATPKERMDMILGDIDESDSEFDRILDKAEGKTAHATAEAEVAATVKGSAPAAEEPVAEAPVADVQDDVADMPAATADAISSEPTADAAVTASTDEIGSAVASDSSPSVDEMVERRVELDARRAAADAKFEAQKERAGDILDELRGELGIEE